LDTNLQLGGGDLGAGSGLMSRPELHDQLMKITSDNVSIDNEYFYLTKSFITTL